MTIFEQNEDGSTTITNMAEQSYKYELRQMNQEIIENYYDEKIQKCIANRNTEAAAKWIALRKRALELF